MLADNELIPFDMYFASLASMQVHPGAGTKEHKKMTLEECRDMAIEMILTRRKLASDKASTLSADQLWDATQSQPAQTRGN